MDDISGWFSPAEILRIVKALYIYSNALLKYPHV